MEEFILNDTADNDMEVPFMDGHDLDNEIRNIIGDIHDDLAATMQDDMIESDEEFENLFRFNYYDGVNDDLQDTLQATLQDDVIDSDEEFENIFRYNDDI